MRIGYSLRFSFEPFLEASTRDPEHLRLVRELDLRSAMVVPLLGQRGVFGAITFVFTGPTRRYTEEDLHLAEELSKRVSMMIERRRLAKVHPGCRDLRDADPERAQSGGAKRHGATRRGGAGSGRRQRGL